MKMLPIVTGSVVISKNGRDEGRLFIVTEELDDDFVLMVNGALRGMDRPKKKRRKHLKPTGTVIEGLAERLHSDTPVQDHEIRSLLAKEENKLVQV